MKKKLLILCLALILLLCAAVPVCAQQSYVLDEADLLTPQEEAELDAYAARLAETYGVGVYMMTVEDYLPYYDSPDVFNTTQAIYHDYDLGYGPDREGMILLLSMAERDYATFFYGDKTEYCFNDYGQERLEEYFLDDFGWDEWHDGFHDYLTASEKFLAKAESGSPVRKSPAGLIIVFILIALAISGIVTGIFWAKMSNVRSQSSAHSYISPDGLDLTLRQDVFINRTRTRRKIQSSSGSSHAHSGGGGSGRSGKF